MKSVLRFINDESGATAIEYALIASGISVAIISVVQELGTAVHDKFQAVVDGLNNGGTGQ